MQHDTTNELYRIMLHVQHTLCSLTYRSECLRKNIVQSLTICQALLENAGIVAQFFIGLCLHGRAQCLNLVHDRIDHLQFPLTVGTKYFFYEIHIILSPKLSLFRLSRSYYYSQSLILYHLPLIYSSFPLVVHKKFTFCLLFLLETL